MTKVYYYVQKNWYYGLFRLCEYYDEQDTQLYEKEIIFCTHIGYDGLTEEYYQLAMDAIKFVSFNFKTFTNLNKPLTNKEAEKIIKWVDDKYNSLRDIKEYAKSMPVFSDKELKEGWELHWINNAWIKVLPRNKLLNSR